MRLIAAIFQGRDLSKKVLPSRCAVVYRVKNRLGPATNGNQS
jgi:hypothetical protein